jgi:hypothetical protein
MSKKRSTIHIEGVVYAKDTDGEYMLDTDGDKIIIKQGLSVVPSDDYEYLIIITEY